MIPKTKKKLFLLLSFIYYLQYQFSQSNKPTAVPKKTLASSLSRKKILSQQKNIKILKSIENNERSENILIKVFPPILLISMTIYGGIIIKKAYNGKQKRQKEKREKQEKEKQEKKNDEEKKEKARKKKEKRKKMEETRKKYQKEKSNLKKRYRQQYHAYMAQKMTNPQDSDSYDILDYIKEHHNADFQQLQQNNPEFNKQIALEDIQNRWKRLQEKRKNLEIKYHADYHSYVSKEVNGFSDDFYKKYKKWEYIKDKHPDEARKIEEEKIKIKKEKEELDLE